MISDEVDIPSTDTPEDATNESVEGNISNIDTNGNGRVTIAEAKTDGFSMPIYSSHWLYKYVTDCDGDGVVGE